MPNWLVPPMRIGLLSHMNIYFCFPCSLMYGASTMTKKLGLLEITFVVFSLKVDVLCLQEHKLRGDMVDGTSRCFGGGITIGLSKLVLATRLRIGEYGLGEVASPCASILDLNLSFTTKVALAKNRVQWIRFKGLDGGHLGILNVYASNSFGERCVMWNEVFQFIPTYCRWIMTSDFNMVDNPLDRSSSSCSRLMGLKEELVWVDIKKIKILKIILVKLMALFTRGIS